MKRILYFLIMALMCGSYALPSIGQSGRKGNKEKVVATSCEPTGIKTHVQWVKTGPDNEAKFSATYRFSTHDRDMAILIFESGVVWFNAYDNNRKEYRSISVQEQEHKSDVLILPFLSAVKRVSDGQVMFPAADPDKIPLYLVCELITEYSEGLPAELVEHIKSMRDKAVEKIKKAKLKQSETPKVSRSFHNRNKSRPPRTNECSRVGGP